MSTKQPAGRSHMDEIRHQQVRFAQRVLLLLPPIMLIASCGTFTLGNVRPQAGKTAEQQQLDTLTCKDQANLAVNSAGRQTGDFLLGMTIVGAPVAYEMDKAKQRQVFADCMQARGYVVTPADGAAPTNSASAATSPTSVTSVPGVDQLAMTLPPGFVMQPVPEKLKAAGAVLYANNRTLDIAVTVIPFRHEGITDLSAFALTKRANQSDWLKDVTSSEVTGLAVGGRNAARYRATGMYSNIKITYVSTLIEGHDQIVFVTAWTGAANAQQRMTVLEGLADTVSGIL
jgi:hypothetical protein